MIAAGKNKQLKISVDNEIASAFKTSCTTNNVSMAAVLSQFMMDYSNIVATEKKQLRPDYSTRRKRRMAILKITKELELIRDFEEDYREKIPEQFEQRHEEAERACEQLSEAIIALEEAF